MKVGVFPNVTVRRGGAFGGIMVGVKEKKPQTVDVQTAAAKVISEAVHVIACMEGWAEDGGFEDRDEAIRRSEKMEAWCDLFGKRYRALGEMARKLPK